MLGFRVFMDLGECGGEMVEKGLNIPTSKSSGADKTPNAWGKAAILALEEGDKTALIDLIEWTKPVEG